MNDGTEFFRSKTQLRRAWAAKRQKNSGDGQSTARSDTPETLNAAKQKNIPDRCDSLDRFYLKETKATQ